MSTPSERSRSGFGYRDVAKGLRDAIDHGTYPPGSTLPHQDTLAEQYGLSQGTIRRAINLLYAEGLVVPRRGHGTVVRDRTPVRLAITRYRDASTHAHGGPWETGCAQQNLTGFTHVVEVTERAAGKVVGHALGIDPDTQMVHRLNHMYLAEQVVQIQETWLPYSVAAGTLLAESAGVVGGIYQGLTAIGRPPYSAEEIVTARMPTQAEAETLRLKLGSPVLDNRRTTRDPDGLLLVHTHIVLDADRVSLTYHQTDLS